MEPEEIKENLTAQVAAVKAKIWATPKPYLYMAAVALLFALGYMGWLKFGPKPAKPGTTVISAPMEESIEHLETETTTTTITYIKDKPAAVAKLGLPASEAMNPKESLLTANAVKANRYGATTAVFVNRSTGRPRTDIVYKDSPWFSMQRGNTVGIEAGYGLRGQYYQADAAHDFFQIKGNSVSGKVSAITFPQSTKDSDVRIGARVERRFDWP